MAKGAQPLVSYSAKVMIVSQLNILSNVKQSRSAEGKRELPNINKSFKIQLVHYSKPISTETLIVYNEEHDMI